MFTLCWAEFPRVSLTASSRGILLPKMVPTSVTASFASGEASATSEWPKAVSDVGSTSDTGQQHKMGVGEGGAFHSEHSRLVEKLLIPPKLQNTQLEISPHRHRRCPVVRHVALVFSQQRHG